MTKAECVIGKIGFMPNRHKEYGEKSHAGWVFTVRVWDTRINGDLYEFHCDNYYGRAILYKNGKAIGDWEHRYDEIERYFESL